MYKFLNEKAMVVRSLKVSVQFLSAYKYVSDTPANNSITPKKLHLRK